MLVTSITTPLILTFNEAPNIVRTLDKLSWAERIVVIDSGSTDRTLEILATYSRVCVFHRKFDDFASQCNFGLSMVETPWVLSLDADYELSDPLIKELLEILHDSNTSGYRAHFVYRMFGHPLRATLYPPRTVLFLKARAHYLNEGHGHRVEIGGLICDLKGKIFHDDRKPLDTWFASQRRYSKLEADYLLNTAVRSLNLADRIRYVGWPAPLLVFLYTLLVKGCIIDGWPGWLYVLQRTLAEIMIASEIVDRSLREDKRSLREE